MGHTPRHLHVHVHVVLILYMYMYTCMPVGYRQDPELLEALVHMYMYCTCKLGSGTPFTYTCTNFRNMELQFGGLPISHQHRFNTHVTSWPQHFSNLLNSIQYKNQKKSFCKTSFQVGMDVKKVQKQGRGERTQEDYPTLEQW